MAGAASSQRSVLLVEDEEVLCRLLALTLRTEGFDTHEANDGKDGLAQALKRQPDVILLDVIMPAMDGIEMLKLLRNDDWGKTAKVMLLTNLGDSDDIDAAKQYGVTDYLIKSDWSLDEIAAKVNEKFIVTEK